AVDLELVDAEQPPELLVDAEIETKARMPGENIPAVAMGVQDEARTLAQIGEAAVADRIDVDDGGVAAGLGDDIVIAHHRLEVGVRNAEGVHHLLAGLL